MTLTFMDLIIIAGTCFTAMSLLGGLMKFFNGQIHARITEQKADFSKQIQDIRDNYAHKDSIENAMTQIMSGLDGMKQEQHRMAQRMDDFAKWVTELVVSQRNPK